MTYKSILWFYIEKNIGSIVSWQVILENPYLRAIEISHYGVDDLFTLWLYWCVIIFSGAKTYCQFADIIRASSAGGEERLVSRLREMGPRIAS